MSIQLNITIQPSRLLFRMLLLMVLIVNTSLLLTASIFISSCGWLIGIAAACLLLSVLLLRYQFGVMPGASLHISHDGKMILRLHDRQKQLLSKSTKVTLNNKTKIWTRVMFVHLDDESGGQYQVLVFPDSLENAHFRALSASLHWIAEHQQTLQKKEYPLRNF
ncbi:protein YgfX [Undibacterium sp. SXout7W]|uniref:protein YgfX n=1 Tax=Undibacterium sp. SXout7W TaxID=3413049 RepID=UPI003BEF698A